MRFLQVFSALSAPLWLTFFPAVALAQGATLHPLEPGYLYPPGGRAGTTVDVKLGVYDGTPDQQLFVFDPRVKLDPTGQPGPILVPPPPYWFGAKSTIAPLPLPREQSARLTLPANLPPGPMRWTVANACGAGLRTGIFWVGDGPEVLEEAGGKEPQKLPALPVTVSGRLARIEEVDRYRFTVAKAGPVTCELFARRLGVNLNAAVTIRDASGRVVADAADTEGEDAVLTFVAAAGADYTVSVNDIDFRGDRSFIYRLTLTPGPRILAAIPAVGQRGKTVSVEFVGLGLASGQPKLESVARQVTFPAGPQEQTLAYRLETPWGTTPAFAIPLGDREETLVGPGPERRLTLPVAATGVLDQGQTEARFLCAGKKGDAWDLALEARRLGSPLDVALAVEGPDGKELARNDDLPGTTDAGLAFTLPADGTYTVVVSDQSGKAGTRAAVYRLTGNRATPDFALQTVARLNVPLGGKADLLVTAQRKAGFKEPIALTITGLPEGVSVPPNLVIPANLAQFKVPLQAAANAPALATLVRVSGTAGTGPTALTRPALAPLPGNLAPRDPTAEQTDAVLLATTMKPRLNLVAVEADGGRKVHRGSTHPAEVTIERLEGFAGEVSLQMASVQSYQRQGINGPDLTVPAGAARAFYPVFMPEWLETTRTSRMALVGVVRVPDGRGKERYLVASMKGQITMSIEGSLLKVSHDARELTARPGETIAIPVTVLRSAKLTEAVRLELRLPDDLAGCLTADAVVVPAGQGTAVFRVTRKDARITGEHSITIRATSLLAGLPVVSETTVPVAFVPR